MAVATAATCHDGEEKERMMRIENAVSDKRLSREIEWAQMKWNKSRREKGEAKAKGQQENRTPISSEPDTKEIFVGGLT